MNLNFAAVVISFAVPLALTGTTQAQTIDAMSQKYPDVVNVMVQARGQNRFDFDVTISSPYDTPQRYADAFRVMSADGVTYGERKLLHDHESEQPFIRDLYGVYIPPDVRAVVVQARDQKYGYGGKSVQVVVPGR
jgi:hypothetical protein